MKKKILFVIILLILNINVYAKENTNKVYDYASHLTQKQEENLRKECNKYIKENDTDVALILLKHTDFNNLGDYTKEFSKKYAVGMDNNFNGIMFVINTESNDIYIDTLGEKEKYYNEININGFIEEIKNNKNYYEVFNMFLSNSTDYSKISIKEIVLITLISVLIDSVVLLIILKPKKEKKEKEINILKIEKIEEKYINSKTRKG